MTQAIILSIGYDDYIVPVKAGVAGKLLELLGEAVPARRDYKGRGLEEVYRMQARRVNVAVKIVNASQILPPEPEEMAGPDVIDLKTLPAARLLLKGPRS